MAFLKFQKEELTSVTRMSKRTFVNVLSSIVCCALDSRKYLSIDDIRVCNVFTHFERVNLT